MSNAAYEFDFLNKGEDFFDDGDNFKIRHETGEDMEGYGLREATQEQIDAATRGPQEQEPDEDKYDFRMEGRGGSGPPPPMPRAFAGKSQNTGPKGVKKDYEDAKRATKINRQMDDVRHERLIRQHVSGRKVYYLDGGGKVQSYKQLVDEEGKVLHNDDQPNLPNSRLGHFSTKVDNNDEELKKMRATRQREFEDFIESVRDHQADVAGEYRRAENLDKLTSMLMVNHPQCHVILHLYDNENPCCQRLHMILEDFAPMFDHVLFVRARSEDVMPNFDKRFLPTFIVYKDKKIVEKLIGLGPTLTMQPDDDAVVKILADSGALHFPTNGLDAPSEQERRREFLVSMGQDDDDDAWLDAE